MAYNHHQRDLDDSQIALQASPGPISITDNEYSSLRVSDEPVNDKEILIEEDKISSSKKQIEQPPAKAIQIKPAQSKDIYQRAIQPCFARNGRNCPARFLLTLSILLTICGVMVGVTAAVLN